MKIKDIMKRTIVLSIIIVLATVLLSEWGIFNALAMFLLVGQIPGTTDSIPASVMLLLLGIITALIIFRFAAIKTIHAMIVRRLTKEHLARIARMPRRRFRQV